MEDQDSTILDREDPLYAFLFTPHNSCMCCILESKVTLLPRGTEGIQVDSDPGGAEGNVVPKENPEITEHQERL